MKLTTFFKLKKPEGVDVVNVDDFNDNFDTIDAALNEAASKSGDMSEGLVFATTASSRSALNSGDSLATILSKLMKWLSDLKTGAFNTVVNNDTTTAAGYVADARVVAEHGTEIDGIDTRVSALETSFPAGCDTIYQGSVTAGVTPTAKTPSALAAAYTAVKNFWIHNDRVGSAAAADVRNGRTFTNNSAVGQEGTMPDLTASNFTGAHSATAAGAASNYTVKAGKAGYVANGTTVNSLAAATSPTIATTAETGTKVINIKPGYYNKISVNQTLAYQAGQASATLLWSHAGRGDNTARDESKNVWYRESAQATATKTQTVSIQWTVRNWQATTAKVSYFIGSSETIISEAEGVNSGTKTVNLLAGQKLKLRCYGQDGANGVDQHSAACCIVF